MKLFVAVSFCCVMLVSGILESPLISLNTQCGIVQDSLIPNDSHVARRGQFPWMAAIFKENTFMCGGSLVSSRIVVTAAHSFQNKHQTEVQKAEGLSINLGTESLNHLSSNNYVASAVNEFVVHPDWNVEEEVYNADIAIAVLSRTIQFTTLVRPICLWTATTSYEDLIDTNGIVSGYGKSINYGKQTDSLKWAELTVVSAVSCVRSSFVFNTLTDRAFCAGDRYKSSGPCVGDSGGPLPVENNKRWYLRGIISFSLLDQKLNSCDTNEFSVFTDAVKFNSWIETYIERWG